MADDVESKFHLVSHSHQSMHGWSRFDFEVTSIDGELTNRPKIVTRDSYFSRNGDLPCDSMQSQVTGNAQTILVVASWFARNLRAAKDDVGILWRFQYNFAQLFIDDLFLRFGKNAALYGVARHTRARRIERGA